ncbi:arsenate reductase (glutaredoxin) [Lysobacter pythonis]|uniref:Arsenate reductase n=1 Tax=Solilutibacter pythonis TaxID=2483112 RepID=A0A3M2I3L1_9GAMM|nr:arsenate reductase (glutaredoxin) [Lysobacter pythonis]RMH94905.1 arsenate reductase (glutaredoxin) [Lysobacter pythonis]
MTRYYHNPRCSKSREALALLQARGIQPQVLTYLDAPPDAATLRALLTKLGIPARELLRKGEEAYKALDLGNQDKDDETIIAAMVEHPILIERPIFEHGERAVIGRPPERVLELL